MKHNYFSSDDKKSFMDLFHAAISDSWYASSMKGIEIMAEGVIFVNKDGKVMNEVPTVDAERAIDLFGVNNQDWSRSFHKTWNKVTTADKTLLAFEQIVNYFSTYGMEMMGLPSMPIVPVEKIFSNPDQIPDIKAFTVIRYVSEDEAVAMIKEYLIKTKAPNKNKVSEISGLMKYVAMDSEDIASFELRVIRYDQLGLVPQAGEEFLRYLIYKLTGKTLLIKSKSTIRELKIPHGDTYKLLQKADMTKLAEIFYRYKPLFLALKSHPNCAPYINKLRRMADKYHKPMSDVNMQNLSKLCYEKRYDEVRKVLQSCTTRQLIKINNFATNESCRGDYTTYNIRNGKAYLKKDEHHLDGNRLVAMDFLQSSTFEMLMERCTKSNTQKGKVFYIPDYVNYAAPVTEKQFIGNIPYGTCIEVPKGNYLVTAVHWKNHQMRTDLDLHLQSVDEAFGWNGEWRDDSRQVMYSGDMTDATSGAVEAFRIFLKDDDRFLLTISEYSGEDNAPFEFFMTTKGDQFKDSGYWDRPAESVCDVKDALFTPIPMWFNGSRSQSIGFLHGHGFYFYGGELGNKITPNSELYKGFIKGLETELETHLSINPIITASGGTIIDDHTYARLTDEEKAEVIDLSPSNLTARTLLDFVDFDEVQ